MATKPAMSIDPMGKTSCAQCDRTIPAGAYRVVLMMVEMNADSYTPGRGRSFSSSYCDSCIVEMPVFELTNIWKLRIDAKAQDALASSAPGEDALRRAWSDNGNKVRDEGPPTTVRTVGSIRKRTLGKFLKDRKSWGRLKPMMREAVTLYISGKGQREIAGILAVDQATVSRLIQGALKIAGAAT